MASTGGGDSGVRRVAVRLEPCGGRLAGVGEVLEWCEGGGGGLGSAGERLGAVRSPATLGSATGVEMPVVITAQSMPKAASTHNSRTSDPNRVRFEPLCAK